MFYKPNYEQFGIKFEELDYDLSMQLFNKYRTARNIEAHACYNNMYYISDVIYNNLKGKIAYGFVHCRQFAIYDQFCRHAFAIVNNKVVDITLGYFSGSEEELREIPYIVLYTFETMVDYLDAVSKENNLASLIETLEPIFSQYRREKAEVECLEFLIS